MIDDRDFQDASVDYAMGHGPDDRVIHCGPTGCGKTVIQAKVAKREMDRGNRTAILTPRVEIFDQTHTTLGDVCGESNVTRLRAQRVGETWNPVAPVHVVSWPTLVSRAKRSDWWFPKVQRILVDECHLAGAPRIMEILERYRGDAVVDGYTATPARQSGMGLGRYFTEIKHIASVRELIKRGFLAECEYWGGAAPELDGIKIVRGDYEKKRLSEACSVLVGDVVDNWLRLASSRHTIVFAVDIAHCEMLAYRFQQAGVKAISLHTKKTQEQRDEINRQFKSQQIQVLCNVGIASYGYDAPSVNCVVLARPTKSVVFHLQTMGRGMRPNPDGGPTMILDHAGNVRALGQADDLRRWRLNEGKPASERVTPAGKAEEEEDNTHECENCHHIFSRVRVCPKCGTELPLTKRDVETKEADLVPIGKALVERLPEGWPSHEVFYAMLRHHGKKKKRKPGWAAYAFKEKCGVMPPFEWNNHATIPLNGRVHNWITSRNIKYARGKVKARKQEAGANASSGS